MAPIPHMAFNISTAIQHLVGIKEVGIIVAIKRFGSGIFEIEDIAGRQFVQTVVGTKGGAEVSSSSL